MIVTIRETRDSQVKRAIHPAMFERELQQIKERENGKLKNERSGVRQAFDLLQLSLKWENGKLISIFNLNEHD